MLLGFLRSKDGSLSSKRLLGSILLGCGIIFSMILFFHSLHSVASDAQTARSIIDMLLISGSSLLGIGVFEKGISR